MLWTRWLFPLSPCCKRLPKASPVALSLEPGFYSPQHFFHQQSPLLPGIKTTRQKRAPLLPVLETRAGKPGKRSP